jgi:hypothetical protein
MSAITDTDADLAAIRSDLYQFERRRREPY